MQNPFLVGQLVYLRPLELADAQTIVPWFNDSEVTRYLLLCRPMSLADEQEFLRRLSERPTDLAVGIAVREGDRLIGTAGLHQMDVRNRHAALGISIGDREAWGKGYGTEATQLLVRHAFFTLNLNRVWLHVYEYNDRALRVYEKIGFQVEGRLRQDTFRDGRYWDTIVMGVLREDWEAVQYVPDT
jgi:RimJ/RimL family protein N-acetyltransferase